MEGVDLQSDGGVTKLFQFSGDSRDHEFFLGNFRFRGFRTWATLGAGNFIAWELPKPSSYDWPGSNGKVAMARASATSAGSGN